MGFEQSANLLQQRSKILHRMLSASGNPGMDNLAVIFNVLRRNTGVSMAVQDVQKEESLAGQFLLHGAVIPSTYTCGILRAHW